MPGPRSRDGTPQLPTIADARGYHPFHKSRNEPDTREGKLLFTLHVTNDNRPGYENRTVLFRGLETELQYKPSWKGNGFLEWIHRTFG